MRKTERNRAKGVLELSKSFIKQDEILLELSRSIFEASESIVRKFPSLKTIVTVKRREFSR